MVWQQVLNGIVAGSAYALVALGYSLIYGVLGLINLAQGEIYMSGAFGLWIAAGLFGWPLPLAIAFGLALSACVGLGMERVVFRPLTGRHPLIPLLAAIGLSIFLQSLALLAFGPETRPFPFAYGPQLLSIGPITVSTLQLLLVATSLALMFGLFWYVNASRHGQALQAVAMDREAAQLVGIRPDHCVAQAFGIGGVLSGAAGMMMAAYYNAIYPYMGVLPGLKGFCAAVLGGAGSIPGAILGGLILGLSENLGAAYINSGFKDGYAFAILIAILLFRPQGLLGKAK
jgi:branched-chain amino acid transport system permease protein